MIRFGDMVLTVSTGNDRGPLHSREALFPVWGRPAL